MNELGGNGKDLLDELLEDNPRKGGLLQYDDLEAGQLICVHSIKGSQDASPIMGQSLTVTSVCFPFFTATVYSSGEVLTLDARFLHLMKVSQEFADSQKKATHKRGPQA